MRRYQSNVRLSTSDHKFLFRTLQSSVREWRFIENADALGIFEVTSTARRSAELARDQAVDMWNSWMWSIAGRQWFLVFYNGCLKDDCRQGDLFLESGSNVLARARCELVFANVVYRFSEIVEPSGRRRELKVGECVRLECLFPPPAQKLKVLPMEEVASFDIFND